MGESEIQFNVTGMVTSAGLKRRCPSCLRPLRADSTQHNFCSQCGYPLRSDSWERRPGGDSQ